MADSHKNFAYGTVLTAPSPATSGNTIVLNSGQGSLMPTVPFNATVWPANTQPLASNAEVVRVTLRTSDTCTIARQQEGSSARTIIPGDQFAATITAKVLTDIETRRDTVTVSYRGTPAAVVFITVLNPDLTTFLSRTSSGVSETRTGWYQKDLSGVSALEYVIVQWDEGTIAAFNDELVTIPR